MVNCCVVAAAFRVIVPIEFTSVRLLFLFAELLQIEQLCVLFFFFLWGAG